MSKRFVALFPVLALGVALPFAASSETSATVSHDLSVPTLGLAFGGEADSIQGSYFTEAGGFVEFNAAVISDHVVQVELHTSTVSASFRADYEIGELLIGGNDELLTPKDWEAINAAYSAISELDKQDVNPIATLYTHRALGMMAESLPGFVWNSWDAKLPVLDEADPSFYDRGIFADDVAQGEEDLQVLRRRDSTGPTPDRAADPTLLAAYPGLPSTSDCKEFLTDSRDGNISCVEYGNYYCIEFDMRPAGKNVTVETIAPVTPPWFSRTQTENVPVPGPKLVEGTMRCAGKCGPQCSPAPNWLGGDRGWALGCLLHDHCVYQAAGGEDLSDTWARKHFHNLQANPSCGDEMRAASDDLFAPPDFCPGNKTVGGSGRWLRYAPPRTTPTMRVLYPNKVSSKKTPTVGSFDISRPKPKSGPNPNNKKCMVNPDAAGCDMK